MKYPHIGCLILNYTECRLLCVCTISPQATVCVRPLCFILSFNMINICNRNQNQKRSLFFYFFFFPSHPFYPFPFKVQALIPLPHNFFKMLLWFHMISTKVSETQIQHRQVKTFTFFNVMTGKNCNPNNSFDGQKSLGILT